jgi:hypothetical protein
MKKLIKMEDWFIETFKPQQNHLDNNASFNGWMYETYGDQIEYIFDLAKKSNRVWTIIEGDDDSLFYVSGFHYVNRLGFIISEKEYEGHMEIECD